MSKKIDSIEALRDHALATIEKLSNHEIDTAEAGVTGKLCESVISTIKAQLEYSRMIDQEPNIAFMGNSSNKTIEHQSSNKSLPSPETNPTTRKF